MVARQIQRCARHNDMQMAFLVMLPTIRRYGVIAFRHLRGDDHDDAVEETIANAYVAFARLVDQGRADRAFPTVLAKFAVAQIRNGRKVGTSLNTRDVMSTHAQRKGRSVVERLEHFDRHRCGWTEAFIEDYQTSVPDQVAFRIDFPIWLGQLSSRNRQVAQLLMVGNSTGEVARHFGISSGRVSQLRRELYIDWQQFHGECPTSVGLTSSGRR